MGIIERYRQEDRLSDEVSALADKVVATFSEQPIATAALSDFMNRPKSSAGTTTSADNQQEP
ncbi:MAG: hypothetical protein DMF69_23080 [Acidobacteria bacterium]|nr:MAG: hypothetical protein DMF69_23080 [Acidobacteriota bacterium]